MAHFGVGKDSLTEDAFLGGRLRILQPAQGYRAGMDAVLLAAAVPAAPGDAVLDLGCGVGTSGLCLAVRVPGIALWGLEVQRAYAELARRNASRAGIAMEVVTGDLADMPDALRMRSFDFVIANPPYFEPGRGIAPSDRGRRRAREEATALQTWMSAASRRLRPGGMVCVIQDAARLGDLLGPSCAALGSVEVLPLAAREGRPARRVIVRARKGGRAALSLLPPVVLHDGPCHASDGDDFAPAIAAVLRDAAPVPGFGPPEGPHQRASSNTT